MRLRSNTGAGQPVALTGGSGLKKEEEKGWKKVGFFDDDDDVRVLTHPTIGGNR